MDEDIKNYIMNLMKSGVGGCKHLEMTQALHCSRCKNKLILAQSEYNRLRKQYPEKFIRKKSDTFSQDIQEKFDALENREKNDPLYKNHLRKLAFGTRQEKIEEYQKIRNRFYETHIGNKLRKTFQ